MSSNTHWAPQQSPINGDVEEKMSSGQAIFFFFFFFLLKCPQPVSMVVCVCLSSDGVRGAGGGEGLGPFSLLGVGVPHSTLSSFRVLWALAGEGTLTLLTALAADQGSGTGMAFSPGW